MTHELHVNIYTVKLYSFFFFFLTEILFTVNTSRHFNHKYLYNDKKINILSNHTLIKKPCILKIPKRINVEELLYFNICCQS